MAASTVSFGHVSSLADMALFVPKLSKLNREAVDYDVPGTMTIGSMWVVVLRMLRWYSGCILDTL